jgi:SpoIIAA-like
MLRVELDEETGVAILEPCGALSKKDFESAAKTVDRYIERSGKLAGIVIRLNEFPGWDSVGALVEHLKFIKEHHEKVARLALVTDSVLGDLGQSIASHFVAAEIRHFGYDDLASARDWILGLERRRVT